MFRTNRQSTTAGRATITVVTVLRRHQVAIRQAAIPAVHRVQVAVREVRQADQVVQEIQGEGKI